MKVQEALHKVVAGRDLAEPEMISVMNQIMEGNSSAAELGAFLTALRIKGESTSEILGAARVMREKADPVHVSADIIVDTCGTGGDGGATFNISTAAAFVVAGCGITVAKHGNRAVSSRSGSADVLRALGVNIEVDKSVVEKCLKEVGIGFLFAPFLHGAMKHAAGVRKELGFRTIFNLLGPLTNPARANRQVIGVFDEMWVAPIAEVLLKLGCEHGFVVHGKDKMDEITLTHETWVCEVVAGEVKKYSIKPEDFGLSRCRLEDLAGGAPEENAALVRGILSGDSGPKSDIVCLNAAAAIVAAGKAASLKEGFDLARQSIATWAAKKKLEDLCMASNS